MSFSKLSLCAFLILLTSCSIKNKNLKEDQINNQHNELTDLQFFQDFPSEDGLNLAIRSYDWLWDKKELSVCWENGNDKNNGKQLTQDIVTSEFAKVGFNFTGWKTCDSNGANIRIEVGDSLWPRVNAIGKNLNNVTGGMKLTFTFDRAGPTGWAYRCKVNENYRDNCIRNYALHEFGHVVGLAHEANRDDSRCSQTTSHNVIAVGEYDEDSIMNYCANGTYIQNNLVPKLSDGDIAGINQLYASIGSNDNNSDNNNSDTNNNSDNNNNNSSNDQAGKDFVLTGSGNHIVASSNILACPDNGDNSGIESINSFDFTNGSVSVKLSLDTGFANHTQSFGVEGPGGILSLRLFQWGNTYQLKARHNTTDIAHKSYSSVNDNYLKISHQAAYNRVTFWTSRDGNSWTAFAHRTFTNSANSMKLVYKCGRTPSNIQNVTINNVTKSLN